MREVSGTATIEDPDEDSLGPAMLALTKAQRRFVMAMVFLGGTQRGCYLAAGYADTPHNKNAAEVSAYRLTYHPKVQAAMLEVGINLLGAARIPAAKFLIDTIKNDAVEMKDRLKATEMVMNRTGMHATSEHKVAVTHKDETSEQVLKEIAQFSKTLDIDPKKLLGRNVLEAEFTEVDETGIEDLL